MCQAVRLNAQAPFLESGTSDDCGRCRAFAAGFGLAPIRPRRTHLYKLLRGLDDEHGEVHLRVVVLGVELADDAQVRLVRSSVDHRARRPVGPAELTCAEHGPRRSLRAGGAARATMVDAAADVA